MEHKTESWDHAEKTKRRKAVTKKEADPARKPDNKPNKTGRALFRQKEWVMGTLSVKEGKKNPDREKLGGKPRNNSSHED